MHVDQKKGGIRCNTGGTQILRWGVIQGSASRDIASLWISVVHCLAAAFEEANRQETTPVAAKYKNIKQSNGVEISKKLTNSGLHINDIYYTHI